MRGVRQAEGSPRGEQNEICGKTPNNGRVNGSLVKVQVTTLGPCQRLMPWFGASS